MAGCRFLNQDGTCGQQNRKCPYLHNTADMLHCELAALESKASTGQCRYQLKSGICRINQNPCNFLKDLESQHCCQSHYDELQDGTATSDIELSRQKLSGLHITG